MVKRLFCVFALASIATVPLFAKVVTSAARPGNFTFTGNDVLIPLTAGGATSLAFSGKGKHAISYSAECETSGSWVSIEIIVDGIALSPTSGDNDAFCSDHNDNNGNDGWTVAHYRVVTGQLALGAHSVQVRATTVGGGTGWLGDSSVVVEK
jgi:hypothetical protein